MPDDGACCCQNDMFQLKDGLLYCEPMAASCAELFLLGRGSRGAGVCVISVV